MKSKSIKGKTGAEISEALVFATKDGFKPTVAVVFLSVADQVNEVRKALSGAGIQIFGASTGNNFTDGDINYQAIVILLLEMNPDYFKVAIVEKEVGDTEKEKAAEIGKAGAAAFKKPAFMVLCADVLSSNVSPDGDAVIAGIESVCGKATTIFGGLASDNWKLERIFVFTNDKLFESGMVALILDEEKINMAGMAVGGWKPIGIDRVITKSHGNLVYTIDNEPARDFIKRYAGLKDVDMDNQANFLLATNFQLQLQREGTNPIMRMPIMANNEDGSILFSGSMPQGSKARLSLLSGFEVLEVSLEEFSKYKNEQPDADALILFSCAGRELMLGPFVNQEIERIKEIWNAPLAGFFCYGEIGRVLGGANEFHNMTSSLAILKEK